MKRAESLRDNGLILVWAGVAFLATGVLVRDLGAPVWVVASLLGGSLLAFGAAAYGLRASERVTSWRICRVALKNPFREVGLSVRRSFLTFSPVITTYAVPGHSDLMVENFDGSLILHLGELGAFELDMAPTGLWTESDLVTGAGRVRELLAWRNDPAARFPNGWQKPSISLRDLT